MGLASSRPINALQGFPGARHDTTLHCTSSRRATNTAFETLSLLFGVFMATVNAMGTMAGPAHPPLHGLEAMMTYLKPKVAKLSKGFVDHY